MLTTLFVARHPIEISQKPWHQWRCRLATTISKRQRDAMSEKFVLILVVFLQRLVRFRHWKQVVNRLVISLIVTPVATGAMCAKTIGRRTTLHCKTAAESCRHTRRSRESA